MAHLPPYNTPTDSDHRVILGKFQISHRFQASTCSLVEILKYKTVRVKWYGRTGAQATWVVPHTMSPMCVALITH